MQLNAYVRTPDNSMAKAVKPTTRSYASCTVSVAPLRREPTHRAEQTSQVLFGERVEVLEHNPETDWAYVKCSWDGYQGWCKGGQLQAIAHKDYKKEARISTTQSGTIQTEQGHIWLPAGSELTGLKKGSLSVGIGVGRFKGRKINIAKSERNVDALLKAALSYLHAPYHWGGRSLAGIDCSGLVQMAFKLCGVPVLRDAAQQATMGTEVHFLAEAQPGDLAFFDNAEGRIVHVGIITGGQDILHATDQSGRVVLDRIDGAGIISVSLKRRTHNLRYLRRLAL
jgi:cell wall-associated NlpC family hydrolase